MSVKQEDDVHMNEILLRQHVVNMASEDSDDEGNIEFDTKRHRSNSYQESGDDRIEKSRERNREHAKKTRLRKKVMLENLKGRLLELQNEVNNILFIFTCFLFYIIPYMFSFFLLHIL